MIGELLPRGSMQANLPPVSNTDDERTMQGKFAAYRGPGNAVPVLMMHFAAFCSQHGGRQVGHLCAASTGTPMFFVMIKADDEETPPSSRKFEPVPVTVSYEVREPVTAEGQRHLLNLDRQTIEALMAQKIKPPPENLSVQPRDEPRTAMATAGRGTPVCSVHGVFPVDYIGWIEDKADQRYKILIGGWSGNIHEVGPFEKNQMIWGTADSWQLCGG